MIDYPTTSSLLSWIIFTPLVGIGGIALSFGMTVTLWDCLVLTPIVWVVAMLPSLGGLGVREGAYVVLFKHFGGSEKALAMSLLLYALTLVASIAGGFLYSVFAGKVPPKAVEEMKEEDLRKLENEPLRRG
jgi:hypothetical protein